MKRIHLILTASLILALAGCMTGCKSKKAVTTPKKQTIGQLSVDSLTASQPAFVCASTRNAKVALEMKSRKINANADIDIDYNKRIRLGAKVMGIEMAIAEIDTTKIRLIDKLNKRYCDVSYQELQQMTGLPVGYHEIQAMLCDRIFAIGVTDGKLKSLNPQTGSDNGQRNINFTSNNVAHKFTFDATHHITATELKATAKKYTFNADYSQFHTSDNVLFPHTIILKGSTASHNATVTVKLPKIAFNSGVSTTAYNVSKLTKVPLEALLSF